MPDEPKRSHQYKGGWPGVAWPAGAVAVTKATKCSIHQARVQAGSVCIECHREQLAAAGVDLSTIGQAMRPVAPAPYSQPYDPNRHGAIRAAPLRGEP